MPGTDVQPRCVGICGSAGASPSLSVEQCDAMMRFAIPRAMSIVVRLPVTSRVT